MKEGISDTPVKYVLADPLMGRKEIQEAAGIGAVEASYLLRSGIVPTLRWGRVRKIKASDFNKLVDQSIEEGVDLLELIRSRLPAKKRLDKKSIPAEREGENREGSI